MKLTKRELESVAMLLGEMLAGEVPSYMADIHWTAAQNAHEKIRDEIARRADKSSKRPLPQVNR